MMQAFENQTETWDTTKSWIIMGNICEKLNPELAREALLAVLYWTFVAIWFWVDSKLKPWEAL